jgi:hypothetical protein
VLRRLFNVLAGISLALCVATVVHHFCYREIGFDGRVLWLSHSWCTVIGNGDLEHARGMRVLRSPQASEYPLGVEYLRWQEAREPRYRWCVRIPDTLTVPVVLVLPAMWLVLRAISLLRTDNKKPPGFPVVQRTS